MMVQSMAMRSQRVITKFGGHAEQACVDGTYTLQSWAGSGACMGAGWVASMACVLLLQTAGGADGPLHALSVNDVVRGCGIASLIGAVAESLPMPEIDNITVPLAVALAGHCVF